MEHISGLETLQHLEILDLADNQVQMQQPTLIIEVFVDGTIFLSTTCSWQARFITLVTTYFQLVGHAILGV